jgi:tRNA dimethylallyltransferase
MRRKSIKPLTAFILGPTGAGKSDFAVSLAKRIDGEIISCDSMQVYKGMRIISQQPKPELLKAVPHHLIAMLNPSMEWSAASFMERTRKIARDIAAKKKIPIVVGGTGLYARALIKGLFPSPPKDEKFRKALYKEAKEKNNNVLYNRLLKIDPAYASKIHSNDLRRIIRALEVYKLTSKPISKHHTLSQGIEKEYNILIFVLNRNRKELYRTIDERIEKMFADGIVREVKKLRRQRMSKTAKAALGYKEVDGYIRRKYSLKEAKELLKKNTRHYAKRQLTWFRKEQGARWLTLSTKKREAVLINDIAKRIKS